MTPEQNKAAEFLWRQKEARYLQLVAGAGSGKTTTLIETILAAQKFGYDPRKICLITFTKKAAAEMRERIDRAGASVGFAGTMHSLGFRLIRKLSDKEESILLHPEKIKQEIAMRLFPRYSHIPAEFLVRSDVLHPEEEQELTAEYESYKEKNCMIDLDDLISRATVLMQRATQEGKPPFEMPYLMVDEFQDTSPGQIEFIKSLSPEKLFVVGDDWQSIYRFRGADVSISLDFAKHFPGATRLFLTKNFRSQSLVVRFGNRAITLSSKYIKKKLRPFHPRGKTPHCYIAHTQKPHLLSLWQKGSLTYEKRQKEPYTVLVRTNHLRRMIEKVLPEHVQVMTIHGSKGLEFDHVVIFGVAQRIFPHRYNDFDEEVRLLYVAATRAKKTLAFIAWGHDESFSEFIDFLADQCKIIYLKENVRALKPTR